MKKMFLKLMLMLCAYLLPSFAQAQSPNFSEVTNSFFSQPKTYSVESFAISMLGPKGLKSYNQGEATFNVTGDGFFYKLADGSGSAYQIRSSIKNVTVLTSKGDVIMPMYLINGDQAVRVIKYTDGHCAVHMYILNNPTKKYIHNCWFQLR